MKQLMLFIFFIQTLVSYGQQSVLGDDKNGLIEAYDLSGKRIPLGSQITPEGNTMLCDQFVPGTVRFAGSNNIYHLMINFSLIDNDLFFKKDSTVLAFVNAVDSFSFQTTENGLSKTMNFKRGYPKSGPNTMNTFYQVVADGLRIELLQYIYKTIEEHFTYGGPSERSYEIRKKLYVYNVVDKTVSEISPTIKSVKKALSNHTTLIDHFSDTNKIKTEESLIQLVSYINTKN